VRLLSGAGSQHGRVRQELISGAQRLKLEERIEPLVRQVTGFRMKFEQIVALPARLTANLLNAYVDFLGYEPLAPEQRPMLPLESGPGRFSHAAVPRGARNWGKPSTSTRTTTPTGFGPSSTWWSECPDRAGAEGGSNRQPPAG